MRLLQCFPIPGQSPLVGRTRSGPVWPSGRAYQVRALWSGVPGQGPYGPLVGYQVRACMALWSGVPGQSPLVGAYQVRARMALFHATLHALMEYMYSVYTAWAVCLIHVHVQCKSPLHIPEAFTVCSTYIVYTCTLCKQLCYCSCVISDTSTPSGVICMYCVL